MNPKALVMIQPQPLPGSYLNTGMSLEEVLRQVLTEAQMIHDMGFDGFILQNMHDGPVSQKARPETIAYMTVIGQAIKSAFPQDALGILINWDGVASLVVADAVKADFARVEHLYTGVSVCATGFMEGQCVEILETKKRLGSKVKIFADVQEVNATYLCPQSKPQAAKTVVKSAYADGIFISGKDTEESLAVIEETKALLPDVPVFLGGGATGDNIYQLLKRYDGVSVATWIKNGDMRNPIDSRLAKRFLSESQRAAADRREEVISW